VPTAPDRAPFCASARAAAEGTLIEDGDGVIYHNVGRHMFRYVWLGVAVTAKQASALPLIRTKQQAPPQTPAQRTAQPPPAVGITVSDINFQRQPIRPVSGCECASVTIPAACARPPPEQRPPRRICQARANRFRRQPRRTRFRYNGPFISPPARPLASNRTQPLAVIQEYNEPKWHSRPLPR